MKLFDSWTDHPIQHRSKIESLDFLMKNEFLTELKDGYFYVNKPIEDVESEYYKVMNVEMMKELKISDADSEIKDYIKKIGRYNAIKDVAQHLIGKIAEIESVMIKEIEDRIENSKN